MKKLISARMYLYLFLLIIFVLIMSGCGQVDVNNNVLKFIRENNFLQNNQCQKISDDQLKIIEKNIKKVADRSTHVSEQIILIYSNIIILEESVDKCFLTKNYYNLSDALDTHKQYKHNVANGIIQLIEKYTINIHSKGIFELNRKLYNVNSVVNSILYVTKQLKKDDAELQYLHTKLSDFNNIVDNILNNKIDKALDDIHHTAKDHKQMYIKILTNILHNIREERKEYDTVTLQKFEDTVQKKLIDISI